MTPKSCPTVQNSWQTAKAEKVADRISKADTAADLFYRTADILIKQVNNS